MFNTLQNTFLDFFGEQNDIKEMSAREFYNSLDKNSLNNIIVTYYILSKNEEDLKDYIGYKPKKSEMVDFICENLKEIILEYFDLKRDYNFINKQLINNDNKMKEIINKCKGYKILNQEPFEMCISYIISQNNNVKRISNSINLLCKKYGRKIEFDNKEYYLFPTYEQLRN